MKQHTIEDKLSININQLNNLILSDKAENIMSLLEEYIVKFDNKSEGIHKITIAILEQLYKNYKNFESNLFEDKTSYLQQVVASANNLSLLDDEAPTSAEVIANHNKYVKTCLDIINNLFKRISITNEIIEQCKPLFTIAYAEKNIEILDVLSEIEQIAVQVNSGDKRFDTLKTPMLFDAIKNAIHNKDSDVHNKVLQILLNIKNLNPPLINQNINILIYAYECDCDIAVVKLLEHGANFELIKDRDLTSKFKLLSNYLYNNIPNILELEQALEAVIVDNNSVLTFLKQVISANNRMNLQALVTKNEKALLTSINNTGEFKIIKKALMEQGICYTAKFCSGIDEDKVNFIIKSTHYRNEKSYPTNNPDVKEKTKTTFIDGKIYKSNGEIIEDQHEAIYVLSKTGKLYIGLTPVNIHHTFFLKGKEGDDLYGFGKPIACGGILDIENGKITKLDGSTGHYSTAPNQIKLGVHYLASQGVIAENPVIRWFDRNSSDELFMETTLAPEVIGAILQDYALVDY